MNARILEFLIVYASCGFSQMTGFSRIEVLQKPGLCPFLQGPQTNRQALEVLEIAMKSQSPEQIETIFYKKCLTAIWIQIRLIPIRNEQEDVELFLFILRDVTPFRQPVEEDFAQNSALGAFAAASDAGSSWGRFARLVFSMVRQRNETLDSPAVTEESINAGKSEGDVAGSENVQKRPPHDKQTYPANNNNNNDNRVALEVVRMGSEKSSPNVVTRKTDSRPQSSGSHSATKKAPLSRLSLAVPSEHGAGNFDFLEKGHLCPPDNKGNQMGQKSSTNSASSDTSSLMSSSRRLGGSRTLNTDPEEHLNNYWSSPELVPRYRPEPPRPPKHVILHYSAFRLIWDWAILLLTGYTAIVVPLRLAVIPRPAWHFPVDQWEMAGYHRLWTTKPSIPESLAMADAVIDVLFCLDIVLNFHTSFVGAGGEVVAETPVIRLHYFRGWFALDLLSCLPYEIIKYLWSAENKEIYSLLDSLRILRLLRIGRAARRIDQYLEYVSTLLLLMILCFFLLAHWFACAWYAVGVLDLTSNVHYGWIPRYFNDSLNPKKWDHYVKVNQNALASKLMNAKVPSSDHVMKKGWSHLNPSTSVLLAKPLQIAAENCSEVPLGTAKEKWSAYLTALYFSLSLLTTIGFGNVAAFTEAEKLLSICCMMIGALVYATIFGNVTTIVQQMYSTRTRYNEIMKGVKDFLRIHEVPQELGERVIDYITSSWSVNRGIDTTKVLNYCPKDMQADISVHLNRCVFNSHSAFRLASEGCRRSLAMNFNTLHTAPGDLIFHQGESVDQLCFTASGSLEVLQDDEVITILGKGDVFGNPSWKSINSVPSAASVRALTYCTLHTIRLERLRTVLHFYHAFSNSFTRNLEVIFRKLADVKREMELSMRRNRDPPLCSLPVGHPVRKLISRLRRSSQACGDLSSGRYGLGTILSGDSSLDASDLENSSVSGIGVPSNIAHPLQQGSRRSVDGSTTLPQTVGVPVSPVPLNTVANTSPSDTGNLNKQPTTANDGMPSENVNETLISTASRPLFGQSGSAKKWVRLISKAQQPKLPNLVETNSKTEKTVDIVVAGKTTASNTCKGDKDSASTGDTQLDKPVVVAVGGSLPLQTGFSPALRDMLIDLHKELKEQIGQVLVRLDGLETQMKQLNARFLTEDQAKLDHHKMTSNALKRESYFKTCLNSSKSVQQVVE